MSLFDTHRTATVKSVKINTCSSLIHPIISNMSYRYVVFVTYQMYYDYPPPTYLEYPILIAQGDSALFCYCFLFRLIHFWRHFWMTDCFYVLKCVKCPSNCFCPPRRLPAAADLLLRGLPAAECGLHCRVSFLFSQTATQADSAASLPCWYTTF